MTDWKMPDWKKLAAGLDPPIPEGAIEETAPVLDALETAFRPLQRSLPADATMWTRPEDVE